MLTSSPKQPEAEHDRTLEPGRHGLGACALGDDCEAEPVNHRVAEHVQRICEQCGGTGNPARGELADEHDGVEREHDPEHAFLAFAHPFEMGIVFAAATGHEASGSLNIDQRIYRKAGSVNRTGISFRAQAALPDP
ncbi:hypothetical protein GCM10028792_38160 [Salinisphaera aquimarina]